MVEELTERGKFDRRYKGTIKILFDNYNENPDELAAYLKKAHDIRIAFDKKNIDYSKGDELLRGLCAECGSVVEGSETTCPTPPCPPKSEYHEPEYDLEIGTEGLTLGDLEALRPVKPSLYRDIGNELRRGALRFVRVQPEKVKKSHIPTFDEFFQYSEAVRKAQEAARKK